MIIENYILETKKQCLFLVEAHFDDLLLRIKNNTAFLDEMNATNAQYDVAYLATPPETPCDIPAPEDLPEQVDEKLENKEVLIEKFGLEEIPTGAAKYFESQNIAEHTLLHNENEVYQNYCAWLIRGEANTFNSVGEERLLEVLKLKKQRFSKKEFDHLLNLIWYRSELLKGKDGAFTLGEVLTQNDARIQEKPIWEEFATKNNLK